MIGKKRRKHALIHKKTSEKLLSLNNQKEKEKEKINNNNNNALIDFSKEKISEIKKDESLDIDSKITEKEFLNELRNKKFSNYSINTTKLMNYERCMKTDNKSNYTSKTYKHSMNINNYFTGKFNNSNNSNMLYNNKTYKNKKYNYITLNRANISKSEYEKKKYGLPSTTNF